MQKKQIKDINVAGVIENGRIVINKGASDGITKAMEFVVYSKGPEILDPISEKSLGKLEYVKGEFKAFHVQDNMTTLLAKKSLNKGFFDLMTPDDNETVLLRSIAKGDNVRILNLKSYLEDE